MHVCIWPKSEPDQDFRAKAFEKTRTLLSGAAGGSEAIQRAAIHALVSMHRDYDTVFGLLTGLASVARLTRLALGSKILQEPNVRIEAGSYPTCSSLAAGCISSRE